MHVSYWCSCVQLYPSASDLNGWLESAGLDPDKGTYDLIEFISVSLSDLFATLDLVLFIVCLYVCGCVYVCMRVCSSCKQ